MSIIVVDPDPNDPSIPWLDADGSPHSTSQLPDGTPIKQVGGWPMALTQAEIDQRVIDAAAQDALRQRTKDQRIEEDILVNAEFLKVPLVRAIFREIIARLPQTPPATPLTPQEFRDAVKARLIADPEA